MTIDAAQGTLVIRAVATGSTALHVTDAAGAGVAATLLVGPNAGFVPARLGLTLTGSPGCDFIAAQILSALLRAARPLPGARIVPAAVTYPEMHPGERLDFPLRVHLDGVGRYVDVDAIANVHITTQAAPVIEPTTLFYSDDPEKIREPGVLYRGLISAGRAIRLYYYHQTATPDRAVAIALDAPNGTAHVRVVGHGAGPNAAVMFVGQTATYRYLDDSARGAGVALEIPVGAPLEVLARNGSYAAGELVAGALDVAVDDGDPVRVTVLSVAPDSGVRALLETNELPSDGKQRRGEYDLTRTYPLAITYAAGAAEPPPVAVGGNGPALPNLRPGGRALAGDYGILRPLALTLTNPTSNAAAVYLYENPTAGYPVTTTLSVRGDAAPLRVPCAKRAGTRYLVRAFEVAPGATEQIGGSYMTDGGSTYPLTFGLTAAPPANPPGSMTAPDGCFPKPSLPGPSASGTP